LAALVERPVVAGLAGVVETARGRTGSVGMVEIAEGPTVPADVEPVRTVTWSSVAQIPTQMRAIVSAMRLPTMRVAVRAREPRRRPRGSLVSTTATTAVALR
jgi:hypothetical protein